VLADAAAGAALGVDDDAGVEDFDSGGADGAGVYADAAVFAIFSDAALGVPEGGAHVDVDQRRGDESAAGAGGHAEQAVAEDAGHHVGFDVGGAVSFHSIAVDFDALGGADADAFAAAATRFFEGLFVNGAGRAEPKLLEGDALGENWFVADVFQSAEFPGGGFERGDRLRDGFHQLAEAGAEEAAAVDRTVVVSGHARILGEGKLLGYPIRIFAAAQTQASGENRIIWAGG
jgi:hypothetical protein